jgi:UDP-glucuronate decarboxylase
MNVKIVRIFNTYGPKMLPNDGRVVSNFIVQALRNEDITVFGDGNQTRSFCYVTDLIDGVIRMMQSGPGCVGPINVGNPDEFTMLELADTIKRMTGSSSRIIHAPLPQDDPVRRRPDISRATAELGWEPSVPLQEGLRKTIDYFEELLSEDEQRRP